MDFYTLEDVAKHDKWIVIDNHVYDVSAYLQQELHPGGNDVLLKYCGGDATERFTELHSATAWKELEAYCIGKVNRSKPFWRYLIGLVWY